MALQTLDEKILLDCISWFRAQSSAAPKEKKEWLFHLARLELGANLTHAMFNAAYKLSSGACAAGRGFKPEKF
jgi:hypothetical protein